MYAKDSQVQPPVTSFNTESEAVSQIRLSDAGFSSGILRFNSQWPDVGPVFDAKWGLVFPY
jgi:hypothetical protein